MSYTKKEREGAALICAIAASGGVLLYQHRWRVFGYVIIRDELGMTSKCSELALLAFYFVRGHDEYADGWTRDSDAESESLIRTGWTPD